MKKNIASQPIQVGFLIVIFIAMATIGTAPKVGINYSDIYREVIAETGFIGLLFYWVIINRRTKITTLTISATRLWLGGLLLFATMSCFWAVDLDFFANKYWLWLASATVFLLTLGLSANTKTSISLSRAIVFVGVYISTIGILQALVGLSVFDQAASPAANLVNKNMAAQIVVLIFPLNVFLLLTDKDKHLSSLYPFAIALLLAYIYHAKTRAAWVSIGVEITLLTVGLAIGRNIIKQAIAKKTFHWKREQTLCSIAAFILLFLLLNISPDGWSPAWGVLVEEGGSIISTAQNSSSQRYIIWDATISMFKQNPLFGSGMGSFYYNGLTQSDILSSNINGVMRAHNDLLELGVELGVIGLILFSGVVICLLINLFRLIRQDNAQQQLFYWIIGAALVGGFVNMQFSFPYQMPVPLMIFGIYSALIVKASDTCGTTTIKTITIPLNPKRWLAGVTFVGILFIGTLALNTMWMTSFMQVDDNIRHRRWIDPVNNTALICSKMLVKTMGITAILFNDNKHYQFTASALNSLKQCAPDSWLYYHYLSETLIGMKLHHRAIETLKKAIEHHPKGEYFNYTRLYLIYHQTNNKAKITELYDQFRAEPEAWLAIREQTTIDLVTMSIDADNLQQATNFYQMHNKYHGKNPQLETIYQTFLAKQGTS